MNIVDESVALPSGCGILTACLTDPLSQFLDRILGNNGPNAVGCYYTDDTGKDKLYMYNIYDDDVIPWMKLGYSLHLLLSSPFVQRITYYPLTKQGPTILSQKFLSERVVQDLEQKFRRAVQSEITAHVTTSDKNEIYRKLWLQMVRLGDFDDVLTGYTVINRVLVRTTGRSTASVSNTELIHTAILGNAVSIAAEPVEPTELDLNYISDELSREIIQLNASFIDLFTTNNAFRERTLNLSTGSTDNIAISNLLDRETELVTYLVGSLENGILSVRGLNEIILQMNRIRHRAGNRDELPLSTNPASKIETTQEHVSVSYRHSQAVGEIDPLSQLGSYLTQLVESYHQPQPLVVNLGTLISLYNNMAQQSELDEIVIPDEWPDPTSRQSTVIMPGSKGNMVVIPLESKHTTIPMYHPDLTRYTETQLTDILIYIDSLRDSDGTYDPKYSHLSNEITLELARRQQK